MSVCTTAPAAARRRARTGLIYLVISGLLWGTGGLTGNLLEREAGLPALSVAAYRLCAGGLAVLASAGMAVLAASGFAAMTLIGTVPVPGLDDLTVTGYGFTIGGALLMAVAAAVGGVGFAPRPATFGLLIALGTGPTAVAYASYFRGLRNSAAGVAALLALLEPLTGTILAVLLLGNRLSGPGIAGAVTLAAAVVVTVLTAT